MSKKLLALLLALVMIVGSFTSVLAENAKAEEPKKDDSKPAVTEEKKEEPAKTEEKKDEKSEEKKEEKKEEKVEEPVKDEYLAKAIDVLKKAGFISGYSKDSEDFKVEKNVTRAEFASMIVRVKGLEASAKALANLPTGFKDVPSNLWANGYIAVAKQQGFVNGYPNGTFQPNKQVSYQDMATMLTIALGQAEAGTVYPAGYIVKAQQLGLFNKVDVPAYTDMATRGNVFKMIYNMVTSKEFAQRKILKAIVLENPRVENLAENQITVEVINVVQKADWVEANRDKRGDQHTYTLDKDAKFDAEGLLGRVVNVTVDKNDKVVDITVDDSYDYLEGTITDVTAKKFELNGNVYSVLFDERYANFDERVYRTYLNDKDYTYEDFATRYKVKGLGAYDYAKITVKNGKVVFIDAFKFDDVAPVAEVKDGNVWYYDDTKDARLVKTLPNFPEQLLFASKGIFSVGDVKAIAKDDVIHFYDEFKKAIVRKDARINDELVKTSEDRVYRNWLHTKDKAYRLLLNKMTDDRFRPVYSFEGKQFNTLESRFTLEPFTGEKIKVLVALNNTVQLVEGNIAWNDGINGIRKIASKGEVKLIPSKGEEFWATEGRDTRYYSKERKDNNKLLNQLFNINDIVYYVGEANKDSKDQTIGKMFSIAKYDTYKNQMSLASIDARYIQLGKTKYRYFDNLHAFYLDKWNNLQAIENIPQFIAENAKNNDLEAYLITEEALKGMYDDSYFVQYYNFLTKAPNVANIVVFNNANYRGKTDVIYAEVNVKYDYVWTVKFLDADRVPYEVTLTDDGMNPANFKQGDIVELHILKDSADKDKKFGYVEKVVIPWEQARVKITDLPRDAYDLGGVTRYFDKDTVIFNRQLGDYVQYYEDEDDKNFVRVVRYFKDGNKAESKTYARNFFGEYGTDPLQFELTDQFGKNNVAYKVNDRTWFVDEKVDYGYGKDGLAKFAAVYGKTTAHKGGLVNVEFVDTAAYGGKLALKVVGIKKPNEANADDAEKVLKKAKEIVEGLDFTFAKAISEADAKKEFKEKVEEEFKKVKYDDLGLNIAPEAGQETLYDLVNILNKNISIPTLADGTDNKITAKLTTVARDPADNTKPLATETAECDYHVNDADEQAKADLADKKAAERVLERIINHSEKNGYVVAKKSTALVVADVESFIKTDLADALGINSADIAVKTLTQVKEKDSKGVLKDVKDTYSVEFEYTYATGKTVKGTATPVTITQK